MIRMPGCPAIPASAAVDGIADMPHGPDPYPVPDTPRPKPPFTAVGAPVPSGFDPPPPDWLIVELKMTDGADPWPRMPTMFAPVGKELFAVPLPELTTVVYGCAIPADPPAPPGATKIAPRLVAPPLLPADPAEPGVPPEPTVTVSPLKLDVNLPLAYAADPPPDDAAACDDDVAGVPPDAPAPPTASATMLLVPVVGV